MTRPRKLGITVVELAVTVAIIGMLAAMTLPAVQASREAARRSTCQGNIRQIGLAMLQHHDLVGYFPSSGWGYTWVGVPGRGGGRDQPGSWIYPLLPYLGQAGLHDLGRFGGPAARRKSSAIRLTTPIPAFNCPSRREATLWPALPDRPHFRNPKETATVYHVVRSDYAANGGDIYMSVDGGPDSLSEGDDRTYPWRETRELTGVSFLRSEIRLAQVVDGASNTYLVGEKYLNPVDYETGRDPGDNESMYAGYCTDVCRFGSMPPERDTRGRTNPLIYGSPHRSGCYIALCDGSVQFVSYDIDPEVHRSFANRRDSQTVDAR